jgi:RNA polymerase sigma-70 factor (ECF subfamily)
MVEVRDRTRESFQRLASAELPALYWLARRLVRDGAEDLVQETLLLAYRSYGTLRQDAAAGPWLKRILVNVFRHPAPRLPAGVRQGGRQGGAPAPAGDLPGPVGAAVHGRLRHQGDRPPAGGPLGTVLARLHRGRKRFEQELWAYAQETGLLLKGAVQ